MGWYLKYHQASGHVIGPAYAEGILPDTSEGYTFLPYECADKVDCNKVWVDFTGEILQRTPLIGTEIPAGAWVAVNNQAPVQDWTPLEYDVTYNVVLVGPYSGFLSITKKSLDVEKDLKWNTIKIKRATALSCIKITLNGEELYFNGDTDSKTNVFGKAQMLALMGDQAPPIVNNWTMYDNTTKDFTTPDFILAAMKIGQYVDDQYDISKALRVQIYAATTKEEIAAINWPE